VAEEIVQDEVPKLSESPLVFISHDSRDAVLAEAFSKLLKSISAGMLKSFRSSDKKGQEGIEFGDDWYKTLMSKLQLSSDVVCLLTENSLDRPWILFEAGVAKGKLSTPVQGLALGVPLSKAGSGPFYQFQNSDESEESISKLIRQLCRRVPGLDPDENVIKTQVQAFKASISEALKTPGGTTRIEKKQKEEDSSAAKLLEEMKLLVREMPDRLEMRISDFSLRNKPRKLRRLHPGMIFEMTHMLSRRENDAVGILFIASLLRDEFPWLYELGIEAYRISKSNNTKRKIEALEQFRDAAEFTVRGPLAEMFGTFNKEDLMILRDVPHIIDDIIHRLHKNPGHVLEPDIN